MGFSLLVISATVLDLVAYSIMPLAIIAPFAALTIVFSTLLASTDFIVCKEPVTWRQAVAIGVVCFGVSTVSCAGPRHSMDVSRENFADLYKQVKFIVFEIADLLVVAASGVFWILTSVGCDQKPVAKQGLGEALLALGAASAGSLSQVALKIVAEAMQGCLQENDTFFQPPMLLGLGGLLVSAPFQILLLNAALARSPSSFIVPIYQALLVILTIVGAGTFFDEFDGMSCQKTTFFVIGVSLSVVGLLFVLRLGADARETPRGGAPQGEKQRLLA